MNRNHSMTIINSVMPLCLLLLMSLQLVVGWSLHSSSPVATASARYWYHRGPSGVPCKGQSTLFSTAESSSPSTTSSSSSSTLQHTTNERHLRFAGVGRLYTSGDKNTIANAHKRSDTIKDDKRHQQQPHLDIVDRLHTSTVAVIGLGGVGSWSAEALCRSGVGNLILVDLDDICISNSNRQLHATSDTVGQMKIDEMKRRILSINPDCRVTLIHDFVSRDNIGDIFDQMMMATTTGNNDTHKNVDAVLDAIDGATEKSALIAACVERRIPIVTVGGAAGRIDPTRIVCEDISRVENDKLLAACRKNLRKYHGFSQGQSFQEKRSQSNSKLGRKWNIPAVYSLEPPKQVNGGNISNKSSLRQCDGALGTACFVTGTYGFVAAGKVVDMLALEKPLVPKRR